MRPDEIEYFVHGTTLGVNALIQRNGAVTGLLVTRGFRDLLEIGRLRVPDPGNFFADKVSPIVPRHLVREVDERMSPRGELLQPLVADDVLAAVDDLVAEGVEAIGICFLHAYRNSAHETAAADLVRQRHPSLFVSPSTEVWPQQREYERAVVAVVNAFVGTLASDYYARLDEGLDSLGVPAGILTSKSNGGVMSVESARERPVETLLSGPASGVVAAEYAGKDAGFDRLIAFDMGGTSAEVAIVDGVVLHSTESVVEHLPVVLPAVDVTSIGAGGGSIAWADPFGVLKVGPESAGAVPGPACYGHGGTRPTVTDAYVELGWVRPEAFNAGQLQLRPDLATAALGRVGDALGLSPRELATGIVDVATANMQAQLAPLLAARGIDSREFALIAYGGAGPTHACLLARAAGIGTVVVPPSPGTLCALGCLVADLKHDVVTTLHAELDEMTDAALAAEFAAQESRAMSWLVDQKTPVEHTQFHRSADMRYRGQAFEITVPLPESAGIAEVAQRFHDQYGRVYGYAERAAPIEIIDVRTSIVGATAKPALRPGARSANRRNGERRTIVDQGESVQAHVWSRPDLAVGDTFAGPAIVDAPDTTVYVSRGLTATVHETSALVLTQE